MLNAYKCVILMWVINMEFKDRIKELRLEKDLNLTQLAVAFDLKESGVRAWELGRTKPGADTLIKLAEYFSCTTDYLLGLSDVKMPDKATAVSELGLSEKTISVLRYFPDATDEIDLSRTLKDVLDLTLSDMNFMKLVTVIRVMTVPAKNWSATQWGDGPINMHFTGSQIESAAYKQIAHEMVDSLVDSVGQRSVDAFFKDKIQRVDNDAET